MPPSLQGLCGAIGFTQGPEAAKREADSVSVKAFSAIH